MEKKRRKDRLVEGIFALRPEVTTKTKKTLDDFAQDLFSCMDAVGYNSGTIRNYTTMYNMYFYNTLKNTEIHKSMRKQVASNLDDLYARGFVYEYRSIAYTVFNHIFNYALALGYITENPCDSIDLKV